MSDLSGQILGERYRVETFLGKGGNAEVYKVWDQQRAVYLAMKVLNADLAEDAVFLRVFEREARILDQLEHPNIVRFYGLEQSDGFAYILMDFIDGLTLRREIFLNPEGISPERALEIMRPVCAALFYSHQMGLIHCDIKPVNIMIHRNGTVYVTDFGIARASEMRTNTMMGAGTPAYMAPEQLTGSEPAPETDVYALGEVLFEMLTGGQRPFTGGDAQMTGGVNQKIAWEKTHLDAPPLRQFNPKISPALEQVVKRCLERDPAKRYPSVLELLLALEAAVRGEEPDGEAITLVDFNEAAGEVLRPNRMSLAGPPGDESPPPLIPDAHRYKKWPDPRLSRRGFGDSPREGIILLMAAGALVIALLSLGIAFARGGSPTPTADPGTLVMSALSEATEAASTQTPTLEPSEDPTETQSPSNTPEPVSTENEDGTWIAFASDRSGQVQVWLMDPEGENRRQVTNLESGACSPAWSPDGEWLAYVSPCLDNRLAYRGSKILISKPDGSAQQTLPLPYGGYDPMWSPDGRHIIYTAFIDNKTSLYSYSFDTEEATLLVQKGDSSAQAAWVPGSQMLSFISNFSGTDEVWMMEMDAITQEVFSQSGPGKIFSYPAWSPDGSWMIATMKTSEASNPKLVRIDRDSAHEGERVFLEEDFPAMHPSFSPDGEWVVFEGWREDGNREIYVASADGKVVRRITSHKAQDFHPAWGP